MEKIKIKLKFKHRMEKIKLKQKLNKTKILKGSTCIQTKVSTDNYYKQSLMKKFIKILTNTCFLIKKKSRTIFTIIYKKISSVIMYVQPKVTNFWYKIKPVYHIKNKSDMINFLLTNVGLFILSYLLGLLIIYCAELYLELEYQRANKQMQALADARTEHYNRERDEILRSRIHTPCPSTGVAFLEDLSRIAFVTGVNIQLIRSLFEALPPAILEALYYLNLRQLQNFVNIWQQHPQMVQKIIDLIVATSGMHLSTIIWIIVNLPWFIFIFSVGILGYKLVQEYQEKQQKLEVLLEQHDELLRFTFKFPKCEPEAWCKFLNITDTEPLPLAIWDQFLNFLLQHTSISLVNMGVLFCFFHLSYYKRKE